LWGFVGLVSLAISLCYCVTFIFGQRRKEEGVVVVRDYPCWRCCRVAVVASIKGVGRGRDRKEEMF